MSAVKGGNVSPAAHDRSGPLRLSRAIKWTSLHWLIAVLFLWLAGCAPSPMLKYGYETPPAALVPIGYAGISDQRARFREIYCAIQQDHGRRFPDDRPCDQALQRLTDEPGPDGKPVYLGNARVPMRLVIIPGLMEECFRDFIQPFSDSRAHVEAPTANYHKPLAEHLMKCGQMVVLVAPSATAKNRELLDGRWDKHDTKDAANIADLVAQGKCLYYECPEIELKDLRGLLSLKRRLKKQEQGLRVRIRNQLLAQYFPEMDRHFDSSVSLAVVRRCLDPSMIAGMQYDEFRRTAVPGSVSIAQERRLRTIWHAAPQSIGCTVGEAVSLEAQVMVSGLQYVRETIKAVQDKIEGICWQFPEYAYLLTIPGIGPDVASKILGAVGNPHRFTSAAQVLKMAGLDLCADRSGKTSARATPVISKRGKSDLRYALYQAAMVASLRNRDFIVYYTTKLRGRERERGIGTKMRVKVAAKLLIIAWTLMKNKEAFNPNYLNKEGKQQHA